MRLTTVKIFVTLFALFLVSSIACKKSSNPSPPPTSDVKLKDGLLLYLPFDGNIADSSGNGNPTIALAGGGLTYDEHGYPNSAFNGTGNGERIAVTNNGSIKFDTAFTFSIEVMIRNQQAQTFGTFMKRADGTGVSFGLNYYNFAVSDSLSSCSDYITSSNSFRDSTPVLLEPRRWYNEIVSYDKGSMKTYLNGSLISTKTTGAGKVPLCPGAEFVIGGWWDGDTESINGILDNVRFYNRILNKDEITELAKNFQSEN